MENVHSLSEQGPYVLQVELSQQTGEQQTVQYQFKLDGEDKKFSVHLQEPGTSGLPFSTADQDNDLAADVNCAETLSGTTASLRCSLKPQFTQITSLASVLTRMFFC